MTPSHLRVYCNRSLALLVLSRKEHRSCNSTNSIARAWHEVAGQDKVVQRIQALKTRGLGGRDYFLTGPSGAGKTTIGRLIASEVADDLFTEEFDASDLTPSTLREIERTMHTTAWGFASGLQSDLAAVKAAFELPWSNGQTEGHIHRLKALKRQMYGRAAFDLLRLRVLRVA